MNLIYVPFKSLTGERFPWDGLARCFSAMEWEVRPEDIDAIREQLANMEFAGDRSINGEIAP